MKLDDEIEVESLYAVDYQDIIEQKLENRPKASTKSFKLWREEVNELMREYNTKFGSTYSIIKE